MPFIIPRPVKRNKARYIQVDCTEDFLLQEHRYSLRKSKHVYWARVITRYGKVRWKVAKAFSLEDIRQREWKYLTEDLAKVIPEEIKQLPYDDPTRREWLCRKVEELVVRLGEGDEEEQDVIAEEDNVNYESDFDAAVQTESDVSDGGEDLGTSSMNFSTNSLGDEGARSTNYRKKTFARLRKLSKRQVSTPNPTRPQSTRNLNKSFDNQDNYSQSFSMNSKKKPKLDLNPSLFEARSHEEAALISLASPQVNKKLKDEDDMFSNAYDSSISNILASYDSEVDGDLNPNSSYSSKLLRDYSSSNEGLLLSSQLVDGQGENSSSRQIVTNGYFDFIPISVSKKIESLVQYVFPNVNWVVAGNNFNGSDYNDTLPDYLHASVQIQNKKDSKYKPVKIEDLKREHEQRVMLIGTSVGTAFLLIMRVVSLDAFLILLALFNIGVCYVVKKRHMYMKKIATSSVKRKIKFRQQWFQSRIGRDTNKKKNTHTQPIESLGTSLSSLGQSSRNLISSGLTSTQVTASATPSNSKRQLTRS